MSRFVVEARRVRDGSPAFEKRRAAFVACVSRSYFWVGGVPSDNMDWYEREFHINENAPYNLVRAINHLEARRNKALHFYHQHVKQRVREKALGKRQPRSLWLKEIQESL
jgi:hypothetical protein